MFRKAIETAVERWDALQFAISNQTGGKESKAVGEWMVGAIEQYFQENDDLEADEVAKILYDILYEDLNVTVDDGSDLEVATMLCEVYTLHTRGQCLAIESILATYTSNHQLAPIQAAPGQEDDEPMDEESGPSPINSFSSMSLTDDRLSNFASSNGSFSQQNGSNAFSPFPNGVASTSSFEPPQQEVENGWTMIKRGKKKPK